MVRVLEPGFSVTTRKIAARVSGAMIAYATPRVPSVSCGPPTGLTAIRSHPVRLAGPSISEIFEQAGMPTMPGQLTTACR